MRATVYLLLIFALLSSATPVSAEFDQWGNNGQGTQQEAETGFLQNPLNGVNSLNDLLASFLNVLVQIGVVVLTLMIVYCGFLFVTAQGNPENLSKAKSALLWTVIGGAIILGAEVISQAIATTVDSL